MNSITSTYRTVLAVVASALLLLFLYYQYAAVGQGWGSLRPHYEKEHFDAVKVADKIPAAIPEKSVQPEQKSTHVSPPAAINPAKAESPSAAIAPAKIELPYRVTDKIVTKENELLLATHHKHGTCLLTNETTTPLSCSGDERMHHEALVHPAMLIHPHPRRVLVIGGVVEATVREVLKHFLVPHVSWVDHSEELVEGARRLLPKQYGYEDPLERVKIKHMAAAGFMRFADHSKMHFDVIIIADDPGHLKREGYWEGTAGGESRSQVLQAAQGALNPGGIVAVYSGTLDANPWEDRNILRRFFPRVFFGTRFIPSSQSPVAYLYATRSEAPPDPASLLPEYIDARLRRTTIGDINTYDGLTHVHMFALGKDLRTEMEVHDKKAREAAANQIVVGQTPPELLHAPYNEKPFPRVDIKGESITREFYGCDEHVMHAKNIKLVVEEAVAKMHGRLLFLEVRNLETRNVTGAREDLEVISAVAITEGGSVSLHVWPKYQYAAAHVTNFNNWAVADEVMNHFFNEFDATKSIGLTLPRGDPSRLSSLPVLDHVKYPVPYDQNPKVQFRESPTAGSGNFAKEKIKMGEVIFKGPIETYLLTKQEIRSKPQWLDEFMMHYGEQAEEGIFVGPSFADLDASYFTNHHCDANLWYADYDTMIARRDIEPGEELNFDYGTIYSDPEILDINPCRCGSHICRKHITGNDWKKPEVQAMHGVEHFWPHIRKRILASKADRKVRREL